MAHSCAPSAFKQDVQDRQDRRKILLILYILLITLACTLNPARAVGAQGTTQPPPTPMPMMPPMPDGLEPPPTVYPPTQASQGAQVYYLVCMACHGDKGQGLTQEWLNELNPFDRNCWQSKCHASNHPPEGFVLPKFVPAIIGPGEMDGYPTALGLHDYIQARMPWQAPGSLSEDEYWQLTAFLVQANGFELGTEPLDRERAAKVFLGLKPTPTTTPALFLESSGFGFWVVSGGVLALIALLVILKLRAGLGRNN